ncbi:hypothetical protein BpHYR1_044330 [Brachionus plicatilis]|uniref:Uncharacterized protein n=1 Tax=Brachionus plicatilis TaxID=10195 RepID=A0A3M7RT04_BRAPC|nr:hypothetical protein BpHYR1_044330 [Brachionus plicatilis]
MVKYRSNGVMFYRRLIFIFLTNFERMITFYQGILKSSIFGHLDEELCILEQQKKEKKFNCILFDHQYLIY